MYLAACIHSHARIVYIHLRPRRAIDYRSVPCARLEEQAGYGLQSKLPNTNSSNNSLPSCQHLAQANMHTFLTHPFRSHPL